MNMEKNKFGDKEVHPGLTIKTKYGRFVTEPVYKGDDGMLSTIITGKKWLGVEQAGSIPALVKKCIAVVEMMMDYKETPKYKAMIKKLKTTPKWKLKMEADERRKKIEEEAEKNK